MRQAGWTTHELAFAKRIIRLARLNAWLLRRSGSSQDPVKHRIRPKAHPAVADIFLRKALQLSNELSTELLERWITLIDSKTNSAVR